MFIPSKTKSSTFLPIFLLFQLMCDESEQKSQRLQALEQKLEDFKREKGEILSGGMLKGLWSASYS